MTLGALLRQYAWNLAYADALTHDVGADLWARSGGPGLENHPAWTLGHLITGSALVAEDLDVDAELPEGWRDLFERRGPNDARKPVEDPASYPARAKLWPVYARLHAQVSAALGDVESTALDAPVEWRFDGYLPTQIDGLLFMLVAHENVHLGQLGCWRRRYGLPSAMAAMERGPRR